MTNREMILSVLTDNELEELYTDKVYPHPYDTICDYCKKKYGELCPIEKQGFAPEDCLVSPTEWLDAEAVKKTG